MDRKTILVGLAIFVIAVVIGAILLSSNKTAPIAQKTGSVPPSISSTEDIEETPIIRPTAKVASSTYEVVKVVDGDTLTIKKGGKNVTIRMIGLDTPETVDPRKPVQCFGIEASNKAKELLTGKSVQIETDISQGVLDKYDRLLAYVYLPDGRMFNHYMISAGYGHEYTYNLPYKYQKQFQTAEARAELAKKGLWADDACANSISPTATPWITPLPDNLGGYECTRNTYNCADFSTQAESQRAFDSCGGARNDIHILDQDRDGYACESLR